MVSQVGWPLYGNLCVAPGCHTGFLRPSVQLLANKEIVSYLVLVNLPFVISLGGMLKVRLATGDTVTWRC